MKNVNFLKFDCKFEVKKYQQNDRFAILLTSAITDMEEGLYEGEPIATATVNMPEIPIFKNQVLIKDYSENTGMTKALDEAGLIVVNENTRQYEIGHGFVFAVDMSDELIELIKNDPELNQKEKTKKRKP